MTFTLDLKAISKFVMSQYTSKYPASIAKTAVVSKAQLALLDTSSAIEVVDIV